MVVSRYSILPAIEGNGPKADEQRSTRHWDEPTRREILDPGMPQSLTGRRVVASLGRESIVITTDEDDKDAGETVRERVFHADLDRDPGADTVERFGVAVHPVVFPLSR